MQNNEDIKIISILPTAQVVLFPHSLLPLHIYESRYQQLVNECVKAKRLIGVGLLKANGDKYYQPNLLVYKNICLGRIVDEEKLADGKYHLMVEGVERARIIKQLGSQPYQVAKVMVTRDFIDWGKKTLLNKELKELLRLCHFLWQVFPKQKEAIKSHIYAHPHPGIIADLLAFRFVSTPYEKQSILGEANVLRRLRMVAVQLRNLIYKHAKERYMDML